MAKRTKTTKTQAVRTRTTVGNLKLGGLLYGGRFGKHSYLRVETQDGTSDYISGQRLYRLAKAIVTRFENAK
jgi:hypothetical protein